MKNDYHEKEVISLKHKSNKSRRDLHSFLIQRGFKSEDDFYFIDRTDKPKPWQAISAMSVNIRYENSSIYKTEDDIVEEESVWDELKIEYLMASLPRSYIELCVNHCELIAKEFELDIEFENQVLDAKKLSDKLNSIANQLTKNFDCPGSENLGILIAMSYS